MTEDVKKHLEMIKQLVDLTLFNDKAPVEVIINQLAAIRNITDAAINVYVDVDNPNNCTHPKEQRIDYSTFTNEHWECKLCGYEYNQEEVKKNGDEGEITQNQG